MPVPLPQVVIPVLHLDLGIFPWIFNAFESEVHRLDIRAAALTEHVTEDSPSFQHLVSLHTQVAEAEQQASNCSAVIDTLQQQLQYLVLFTQFDSAQANQYDAAIQTIQQQIQEHCHEKNGYEIQQQQLLTEIQKKSKAVDGPCKASIEPVLQGKNIQRQAYHGRAFVGNHVGIALQPDVIQSIVEAPSNIIENRCPSLMSDAKQLLERYKKLFLGYATCRKLFSHCQKLSEADLSELDLSIKELLKLCRTEIVERKMGNITPKLHLLESHTVSSARRFGVGLGLLGEQGSESIHARFNALERDYHSIPNQLERYRAMSQQHLVSTLSQHGALRPATATRKRSSSGR